MEKEEIIVAEKQTEILLESGTNELELLKLVIIYISCEVSPNSVIPNAFDRLITVISISRGIKIPSINGCAFGTGVGV